MVRGSKQIAFDGQDSDAGSDIVISLFRGQINVPLLLGSPTRTAD